MSYAQHLDSLLGDGTLGCPTQYLGYLLGMGLYRVSYATFGISVKRWDARVSYAKFILSVKMGRFTTFGFFVLATRIVDVEECV